MSRVWLLNVIRVLALAGEGDASNPLASPAFSFPTTNVRLTASLDDKDVEEACRALVVSDDVCRQIDILT